MRTVEKIGIALFLSYVMFMGGFIVGVLQDFDNATDVSQSTSIVERKATVDHLVIPVPEKYQCDMITVLKSDDTSVAYQLICDKTEIKKSTMEGIDKEIVMHSNIE